MKKNSWRILVGLLSLISLLCFYYQMNDGFMIFNIYGEMEHEPSWQQKPTQNISMILNQPYRYLGKGCQSYVFVSQDEKYVIKFLKHQHLRNDWWWDLLPLPQNYRERLSKKRAQKQEIFNAMAKAALIAENALKEETGVLYTHMYPSKDLPLMIIIDKIGWKYSVDLQTVEFIIQKKATPALSLFALFAKENNHLAFQEHMEKILDLLKARFRKGYYDNDRATLQNVGFSEGKAVILDTGKLDVGAHGDPQPMLRRRLSQIRTQIHAEFPVFSEDIIELSQRYCDEPS